MIRNSAVILVAVLQCDWVSSALVRQSALPGGRRSVCAGRLEYDRIIDFLFLLLR